MSELSELKTALAESTADEINLRQERESLLEQLAQAEGLAQLRGEQRDEALARVAIAESERDWARLDFGSLNRRIDETAGEQRARAERAEARVAELARLALREHRMDRRCEQVKSAHLGLCQLSAAISIAMLAHRLAALYVRPQELAFAKSLTFSANELLDALGVPR